MMPSVCRYMEIQYPNDGGCLSPVHSLKVLANPRYMFQQCNASMAGSGLQFSAPQFISHSGQHQGCLLCHSCNWQWGWVGLHPNLLDSESAVFEVLAQCGPIAVHLQLLHPAPRWLQCVSQSSPKVGAPGADDVPTMGEKEVVGGMDFIHVSQLSPRSVPLRSSHYTHLSNYTMRLTPLRMKCDQSPSSGLEA